MKRLTTRVWAIVAVVGIFCMVVFLIGYARYVQRMVDAGFETGGDSLPRVCFDLRDDIYLRFYSPRLREKHWAPAGWAHASWSLLSYGDGYEGTATLFAFPSWYLLMPLLLVSGYAGFNIIRMKGRDAA